MVQATLSVAGFLFAACAGAAELRPAAPSVPGPEGRTDLEREPLSWAARAAARSPMAAMLRARAQAVSAEADAQGALAAPELGLELANVPLARPYDVGDAEMIKVELRQRFAPLGVRQARANASRGEARALLAEALAQEQKAAGRARLLVVAYAQAVDERRVIDDQLAVLDQLARLSRGRYATDGARLAELARIDTALAQARRARLRRDGEVARAGAELAQLLFGDPSRPLPEPAPLVDETVASTLPELLELARRHRGTAQAAAARREAAAWRRRAERAEQRYPELVVGAGYWQDPTMRPGYAVSAMLSLPWLWGPSRPRAAAARFEESAEGHAAVAALQEIAIEVAQSHAALTSTRAQLVELVAGALPAARRAVAATAAAYPTGGVTALEWLDASAMRLDLELEAVMLRGELARQVVELEAMVGAALPRTPLVLPPQESQR